MTSFTHHLVLLIVCHPHIEPYLIVLLKHSISDFKWTLGNLLHPDNWTPYPLDI